MGNGNKQSGMPIQAQRHNVIGNQPIHAESHPTTYQRSMRIPPRDHFVKKISSDGEYAYVGEKSFRAACAAPMSGTRHAEHTNPPRREDYDGENNTQQREHRSIKPTAALMPRGRIQPTIARSPRGYFSHQRRPSKGEPGMLFPGFPSLRPGSDSMHGSSQYIYIYIICT